MELAQLDSGAREILRANDRGGYTIPTSGLYPYQWNWDSAFAALGFAQFDLARAWTEFETLFSGQWANGMVPHILFHRPDPGYFPGPDIWGTEGHGPIPSSGISQPPVAATLMRRVWETDKAAGAAPLAALYPKLLRWHRWFMHWRREGAGTGAIVVTHPWESGRDNAPDWDHTMAAIDPSGVAPYERRDTAHVDAEMRPTRADYDRYIWLLQLGREAGWDEAKIAATSPFRVADPTMSFILLRAHRDLAVLGRALGQDVAEIEGWIADLEAAIPSLWNPALGAYDARDLRSGRFAGSLSSASFLCWYGGVADPRMGAQFDRVMGAARYGMASADPDGPHFDPKRYWRGPIWAVVNTLIGIGLQDAGEAARAERLRASTQALIATHGFAEYFDPQTGAPAGGDTFTWTAAVWLGWVRKTGGADGRD